MSEKENGVMVKKNLRKPTAKLVGIKSLQKGEKKKRGDQNKFEKRVVHHGLGAN